VWSGAGISVDDPTGGPIGPALTERGLGAYFDAGVLERLRGIYDVVNPERKLPRLETVLDALTEVYGRPACRTS
jgi:hypothetical protein